MSYNFFMRILHVHKYFHSKDGASRYERGLMRLQEEAGHTVAPFAMHDERNEPTPWSEYFVSNIDTQSVALGFSALKQLGRALWSFEAKRKMENMLDVFKPDIVHVHNIYTQLSPSILSAIKKRGIPIVMTVHDYALLSANYSLWDAPHSRSMDLSNIGILATTKTKYIKNSYSATLILELILKLHHVLGLYDGMISHYTTYSNFVKDLMVKKGFSPSKISVLGAFAEPLMASGALPNVPKQSDRPSILFAGRLESYKGVHILIEAMKILPPSIHLKIAGTGPDTAKLKALAKNNPSIEFLGFVPGNDLWKLMAEATVVVVPSVWEEVYGLVALEALCYGTPVVVAKSGGLQEVVGDSQAGSIVPPNNPKALANAIKSILDNPELRSKMSENAIKRAHSIGNPQEHLAKVMAVYSGVDN